MPESFSDVNCGDDVICISFSENVVTNSLHADGLITVEIDIQFTFTVDENELD